MGREEDGEGSGPQIFWPRTGPDSCHEETGQGCMSYQSRSVHKIADDWDGLHGDEQCDGAASESRAYHYTHTHTHTRHVSDRRSTDTRHVAGSL